MKRNSQHNLCMFNHSHLHLTCIYRGSHACKHHCVGFMTLLENLLTLVDILIRILLTPLVSSRVVRMGLNDSARREVGDPWHRWWHRSSSNLLKLLHPSKPPHQHNVYTVGVDLGGKGTWMWTLLGGFRGSVVPCGAMLGRKTSNVCNVPRQTKPPPSHH